MNDAWLTGPLPLSDAANIPADKISLLYKPAALHAPEAGVEAVAAADNPRSHKSPPPHKSP